MKSLYLVDGNNVVHRCYHATKKANMTNGDIPTGAIYGFQRTIMAMIKALNISNLIVLFDHKGKLDRHNIYEQYKANRVHNEEVSIQYPYIMEWCSLYGIQILSKERFEADDLIYTIHKRMYYDFDSIYIVSNDKDLYQLVDEKTSLVDTSIGYKETGKIDVYDKFGILPSHIRMFLAITGDNSDNIPGCKGIGKIGAKRLVNEYGPTFNSIYSNISKIDEKISKKLMDNIEDVKMSYELIGLTYVEDLDNVESKIQDSDEEGLMNFYKRMKIGVKNEIS